MCIFVDNFGNTDSKQIKEALSQNVLIQSKKIKSSLGQNDRNMRVKSRIVCRWPTHDFFFFQNNQSIVLDFRTNCDAPKAQLYSNSYCNGLTVFVWC